jgi:hypothetical protein
MVLYFLKDVIKAIIDELKLRYLQCKDDVSPEDRREIIKMRNITDHPESRFFLVNTADEELLTEATVRLDQLANHFVGQIDEYICNRFNTPTV